jgi:hypothetical protein
LLRDNLFNRLLLKLRQLKVIEHYSDEFLKGDIGLERIKARLITAFTTLALPLFAALLNNVPRFLLTVTLRNSRGVLSIDESVLFDGADRHLDNLTAVPADD